MASRTQQVLPLPGTSLRVVVAHDYTTQTGGAERVALALLQAFPSSRLVTSTYNPRTTFPEFADFDVEPLWVNRVPAFRRDPRLAFPFLAKAWESHVIEDADLVICSTSGWAHGVTTTATKIAYCHNPARWLYQPKDYLQDSSRLVQRARNLLAPRLMEWDQARSTTVDRYIANSNSVAGRILDVYGKNSTVIPPAVTLDPDGPLEAVPGIEPGFFLSVARARGYKNVDLICQAVEDLPSARLVVLGDLPEPPAGRPWGDRLTAVGRVSDAQLRWLYANCRALVSAAREDFGLTPLEANLFGKPAVLIRAGGFLDTLVEGITGCFFDVESAESVREALQTIPVVQPSVLRTYGEGFRLQAFGDKVRAVVDETLLGVGVRDNVVPTGPSLLTA